MPEGTKDVTLNSLARELGLAKSTVSRALNGYPDISDLTQERVRAAALRSGYRASSTARNLKRGRVDAIGVVLSSDGPGLANPFFTAFLHGVTAALDDQGFDLVVASSRGTAGWRETYDRLIASRKVDGFILTRTECQDPRVDFLRNRGAPFVTHGRTSNASQYAWFDMDNARAFREATERLAGFGHRRIGFVGGAPRMNFSVERLGGYQGACIALGLERDEDLIRTDGLTVEDGARIARDMMAMDRPPTALLCIRDEVALGAMQACRALGLRVGRDVSIIGYDDVPHAQYADPPLTTFNQDSENVGRRIAQMAASLIGGQGARNLQEIRPARLMPRHSDGPCTLTPESLRAWIGADCGAGTTNDNGSL